MAYFAPIGLLALIPTYLILTLSGFAAMYWAVGNVASVGQATQQDSRRLSPDEPLKTEAVALAEELEQRSV